MFVIGDFFFDSVELLIKKVVVVGILMVVFNFGCIKWKEFGVIGFVGEDLMLMGKVGGEVEVKVGVKNGICVDYVVVNFVLE